jgi:hypothetical protein
VLVYVLLLVGKLPPVVVAGGMLLLVSVSLGYGLLLGVADADHGDTCGCLFLLGGVFLG